jgi:hypothetical protein
MNELPTLAEHFHNILAEAQTSRPKLSRWVDGELEWVLYERQVMFDAVNELRHTRMLSPIKMCRLMDAERSATGHSDYTHKFALYCAELVLE